MAKVTSVIPKDPKTYVRAGIASSVAFLVLGTVAKRVPAVQKVRDKILNGI